MAGFTYGLSFLPSLLEDKKADPRVIFCMCLEVLIADSSYSKGTLFQYQFYLIMWRFYIINPVCYGTL